MTEYLATNFNREAFEAAVIGPFKGAENELPTETRCLCDIADHAMSELANIAAADLPEMRKHRLAAFACLRLLKWFAVWHDGSEIERAKLIAEANESVELFFKKQTPNKAIIEKSIAWIRSRANAGKLDEIEIETFMDERLAAVFWQTPAPLLGLDRRFYIELREILTLNFSPKKENYFRADCIRLLTAGITQALTNLYAIAFDPMAAGLGPNFIPFEIKQGS